MKKEVAFCIKGIIIVVMIAQKLFFKYAFNDDTADESKAAVRRKRAEKAAKKEARVIGSK